MDNLKDDASRAQSSINNTMTKENAAAILSSRKLITETGKYYLKVTNSTPFDREVAGGDSILTQIVNFAGMTDYQLKQAKQLFREGKFQEATNVALTSSRRIGMDFIPKKGDICEVIVDYVALRDFEPWAGEEVDSSNPNEDIRFPQGRKNQQGLLVVGVQAMPVTKANNVKFSLDEDETETEASLVDEYSAAIINREASIDAAEAKGAGAPSAKIAGTGKTPVEQPANL